MSKCPSWKWFKAADGMTNPNLPEDKQYLKTTGVLSYMRADDFLGSKNVTEFEDENGWTKIGGDVEVKKSESKEEKKKSSEEDDDDDDDDGEIHIVGAEDGKVGGKAPARSYDISVTYDFYYCVPRMWIMGYSPEGKILTEAKLREDVMKEYRNQTVTVETHPYTGEKNISVHPCKHSLILKKLIDGAQRVGKKLEIELCIILFLKFLQSVIPTIEYDFTMEVDLNF